MCNELLLRFEPQIRSTRFAMKFLFIIATTERKVHFRVKLVDHSLKFVAFCPKFYSDSSTPRSFYFHIYEFLPEILQFYLSSYYAEKFQKHLHKYFHMSFVSCQGGTSKKKRQKKI